MMFETSLTEKLQRIFDLKKVTFDMPSESHEQECIFIEVDQAKSSIKDGSELCMVRGKLRVYCNNSKLPYGYFGKKIRQAELADTKDLFFYDLEENAGQFQNIALRSMSFVYFYNGQYNPELGSMTSIELETD